MSKTVEEYLEKNPEYTKELTKLREIIHKTELVETVKWGIPTYTINGKNVVGIGAFKSYAGLWFFQGSFLKDPQNLLINAQEGKTKGMRQMRFENAEHIDERIVKEYLLEAIENQKQGKEIKPEKKKLVIPDELKEALSTDSQLAEAFDELTPGKQKEYAEYIHEAKQAKTKLTRLEKITPMIKSGVGLNDRYK
ncbi:YdeI/OmpD-associated family protein [Marinoscillum sp.]|uniref:YdeI/OmpD-associated family protein n=1 Tax=Marinoscillum sp. TaxID=2024838 RepID=UPI003BAC3A87